MPPTPKPIEPIKEVIFAKHTFTQEELIGVSQELARTITEITTLEQQKSAVTKDFGGRIESKEIHRDGLVEKVGCGFELRETECLVVFDPKNRSKDYFKLDHDGTAGEFVERREMTQADFQLALPTQE